MALALLAVGGCSSMRAVNFNINSEPNGSHVVLQKYDGGEWIYLGNTPVKAVTDIDTDRLHGSHGIAIKVMRAGYYDQVKELDAPTFWQEYKKEGSIFWSPRMVPVDQ